MAITTNAGLGLVSGVASKEGVALANRPLFVKEQGNNAPIRVYSTANPTDLLSKTGEIRTSSTGSFSFFAPLGKTLKLFVRDTNGSELFVSYDVQPGVLREEQTRTQTTVYAEEFPGANDTQRWQNAINTLASANGGIVTTRAKSIALTNIKATTSNIELDFNNASIIATPSLTGAPAIWGTGAEGTRYAIDNTFVGSRRVKFSNIAHAANFAVGEFVRVADTKFVPAWNAGNEVASQVASFGYTGREEISRVEGVDLGTGEITLAVPIEFAYENAQNATVSKLQMLKGFKVRNIGSITEPDPGSAFVGSFDAVQVPHLISADYAEEPVVQNVFGNWWQLHLVNFRRCWSADVSQVIGRDAYRPAVGGHGYLIRYDRTRYGLATQNRGSKVRHTIDHVMAMDLHTSFNVSEEPVATAYGGHGLASKRWTSTDDTANASGNIFVPGWNVGNPAFSGDFDCVIVRPRGKGLVWGIDIGYGSKDVQVLDPQIETYYRAAIHVHDGAEDVRVVRGSLKSTYGSPNVVLVHSSGFGAPWGLNCRNVTIDGVKIDATGVGSATPNVDVAVELDALGNVEYTNCAVTSNAFVDFGVRIGATLTADSVIMDRNKVFGVIGNAMRVDCVPTQYYSVRQNHCPTATISTLYLRTSPLLELEGNRGSIAASFMTTDIAVQVAAGAIVRGNLPAPNGQFVGAPLNIGGPSGGVRDLTMGTTNSGTYSPRWIWRVSSTAESGANAGSDIELHARSDAGAGLTIPISITRSTGFIAINTSGECKEAFKFPGTFDKPLILGVYRIWISAAGKLMLKNGAPANEADGTVVGTQV